MHPSLEALLERSPEGAAHLAGCEPCRGLVALLSAASAGAPRKAVPRVERSTYSGWEDLPDARGGMGRLFRALDTRLGREVAIKQVRAAGGTESGAVTRALLARLEREAKLTARLQHPGIVVVYEVGQFEDGELFYSMPLVRGRPLSREIERRPTLSGRLGLVALITNVAEALAYSHSQDIVHRDVKPDNIIVGAFGEAVLIDWGIAKDLRAREEEEPGAEELRVLSAGLTELGVGTAQYMAPEQARGAQPSAAMDVYALGATLYHALSGEPPWGAADPSEVRRLLREGPPRPLDALAPQVPAELVHICERAMARDPLQRYASARELADELHRFQTGRLLQSRSYTAAELLRHWARRHRASLSVGAAALLALVLLTVAGFVQIDRQRRVAQDERRRAEWSLRKAQGLLASQLAVEPAQRLEALSLATAAVGPELAAATPALASSEATQGLYDAVVKGPAALSLDHPGAITNFAVSPDGARLAGTGDDGTVLLWDARSGRRLGSFSSKLSRPHQARFSPDGRLLSLCGPQPGAEIFDTRTGVRLAAPTQLAASCEFAPDGSLVTAAEELLFRDPETLTVRRRLALPVAAAVLSVAKNGDCAVASVDGSLRVFDHAGGDATLLAGPGTAPVSLRLDGAGARVVLVRSGGSGTLWTRAGAGWTQSALFAEPDGVAYASRARFSPAAALLAVPLWSEEEVRTLVFSTASGARTADVPVFMQEWAGDDRFFADARGPLQLIDGRDGRLALTLAAHRDEVKAVASLGDGAASASRDGEELLWDLRPGLASGLLLGHTGEVTSASVEGDRLLTASLDGSVRAWSLSSGAELFALREGSAALVARWSEDGRALAGFLDGSVWLLDALAPSRKVWQAAGPITAAVPFERGKRALCAALDGRAALVDLRGGLARELTTAGHGAITAAAVAPGDRAAVTAHADGSVRRFDLATLAQTASLAGPSAEPEGFVSLAFSAGRLFLGRAGGTTQVVNPDTLAPLGEVEGRAQGAIVAGHFAALTADGRVLVRDVSGAAVESTHHRGSVLATDLSRDARVLASGGQDGVVRLFDLREGRAGAVLDDGLGPVTALALSADARWVVVGHASGALRIHPASLETAFARACGTLRKFERPAPYCRSDTSPNASRDR